MEGEEKVRRRRGRRVRRKDVCVGREAAKRSNVEGGRGVEENRRGSGKR